MTQPILLALSSFRQSDAEIAAALSRCAEAGAPLVVLFVVDINLARYLTESGTLHGSTLRQQLEDGLLDDHRRQAETSLRRAAEMASAAGVACRTVLRTGRFADEVKSVVEAEQPQLVILTRARRPDWLRRLFGSPVGRLTADLGKACPVEIF